MIDISSISVSATMVDSGTDFDLSHFICSWQLIRSYSDDYMFLEKADLAVSSSKP